MKTFWFGWLLVALFVSAGASTTKSDEPDESPVEMNPMVRTSYQLKGMAVYKKNGQFSPTIFLQAIQTMATPNAWEAVGGPATLAVYPQPDRPVFVINAPEKTHHAIEELLGRRKPVPSPIAPESEEPRRKVRYGIGTLPVYDSLGVYAPELMMNMIQFSATPDQWESRGGSATMVSDPMNTSIEINATESTHTAVQNFFETIRMQVQRPRKPKP